MAAPHMWKRIDGDFSPSWLSKTAETQLEVERCIDVEDLPKLVSLHSGTGAEESLDPFNFQAARRDAADIQDLLQQAKAAEKSMVDSAEDSRSYIEQLVMDAMKQAPDSCTQLLRDLREDKRQEVQDKADRLGQIADEQHALAQAEVLADELNLSHRQVTLMPKEERRSKYKEIRMARIVDREETTFQAATALLQSGNRIESLDQVLEQYEVADGMQEQERRALANKGEVNSIVEELKQTVEEGKRQLEGCKAKKLEVSKELDRRRAVLKECLNLLIGAEEHYQDTHIEHEALRLQVKILEQSIQETETRLSAAEEARGFALGACGTCMQEAALRGKEVRSAVTTAAKEIVKHAEEPVRVATQNVLLGTEWLSLLLEDKDAEMSMLETEKERNEKTLNEKKQRLRAPHADVLKLQEDIADLKDKQSTGECNMAECREKRDKLNSELAKALEKLGRMKDLAEFGCAFQHEDDSIKDMAKQAYKDFPLWNTGLSMPAAAPSDAGADHLELANLDVDVQKMIEDKLQQAMIQMRQQMMADMRFRTSAPPDMSDSTEYITPEMIHSDGTSTASSMHRHGE